MTSNKLTTAPTEADLEAEIHRAIAVVFPWLPAQSIKHQTKFSFTFGRKKINVDGLHASQAEARSDIILYAGDTPLAVLELKRAGEPLTSNDDAQGLSYARVLNPYAPLVIVTNGTDIHILETHTGKLWRPTMPSEQAFQDLVTSAVKVADLDVKKAVDALMGTNAAVWMQAVRQTTAETIDELCDSWDEPARPFAHGFLISRKATSDALRFASEGAKLILIEGPPLSGKSNVLRDISQRTEQDEKFATLYIEAGIGANIHQSLADTLARSLAWPVTKDEARNWLIRLSQSSNHRLLLAIDSLDAEDNVTRREIEDLTSATYGPGLLVIVAVDDATAERIVKTPNGLSDSPIGRRANRIKLDALDDDEFEDSQQVLLRHRIRFIHGAQATPELRQPWVLRAISAPVLERIQNADANVMAVLPSLLSLEIIRQARKRFTNPELCRLYRATSKALLADSNDGSRYPSLVLDSLELNLVRRETLSRYLQATDLNWLIDHGFLKPAIHASGDAVLFVRLPELVASELARLLSEELISLGEADPIAAAKWLAKAANNLPIGDVIAAQAVSDAAKRTGRLSLDIITALLEWPPKRATINPGSRFGVHIPGRGIVEFVIRDDGTADLEIDGKVCTVELGDDGMRNTYEDVHPWLILSHFAGVPLAIDTVDGDQRLDAQILLHVGTCDIVLRKPGGKVDMRSALTHDVPNIGSMVCHEAGIIEPITLSLYWYLLREGPDADDWIDDVIGTNSMPLLMRVYIALLQVTYSANNEIAEWAKDTLALKILPAFKLFPALHGEGD